MDFIEQSGRKIPMIGFGTSGLHGEACQQAVIDALAIGYRHIDTAVVYENEKAVGDAVRAAGIPREDLLITTKIAQGDLAPDAVRKSLEGSLDRLGMEYVDLWLIHWPNPNVPLHETLEAMLEQSAAGRAKSLGVSNFSRALFEEAASIAPILCNQVEYHPYRHQDDVLASVRRQGAFVTAYSPLAKGDVRNDETLRKIGDRYGKTPAQVALRWLIQQPQVVAIPKAAKADHRRANLKVFDFALTDEEMREIADLAAT